ncbi:MAG: proline iminopeptidase-family hydrolase [Bdellovibrionales bacterium]|nr:proline iminopeptidase-family hydrolase [Bdellovibrionales bacterium]
MLPDMPFITHKLGTTYFCSRGKRSAGMPLVFCHGGPGGTHDSLQALLDLSKTRQVFLYDQIGGGRSTPLQNSNMKISTFVWELRTLVEKWNLNEFHLGGASWGATLALEYYLRCGKSQVRSLSLQSPYLSSSLWIADAKRLIKKLPKKTQKVIRYCEEISAFDAKVYKDAVSAYGKKHICRVTRPRRNIPNTHGEEVYNYMWGPSEFTVVGTLKKYERRPALSSVKIPVLYVCGEHDEATPESCRKFAARTPSAQIQVIPKASHIIGVENPSALKRCLTKFLQEVELT